MADYQEAIRKEITSRRGGNIFGGIRAEIGRIKDPELRIVLEHMLHEIDGEFDSLWGLMDRIGKEDVATKTVEKPVVQEDSDTQYTETNRLTTSSTREVSTDDEIYTVTVEDITTTQISLKGNKTGKKMVLKFS